MFFFAFDLLYFEEWDIRQFPLLERKATLASMIPANSPVLYVDHERSRVEELVETVSAVDLGGVVGKRASNSYHGGPSPDWVETPVPCIHPPRVPQLDKALTQVRHQRPSLPSKMKITNRGRVLWPRDGYTEGDLIDYYDVVADDLLSHLKDRPLSLNRYPSGIEGEHFFQEDMPGPRTGLAQHRTREVATAPQHGKSFCSLQRPGNLLYLANLAASELHPWSSRIASLEQADWAILDQDPTGDYFFNVVRVSRAIGKLLSGIGLRSYPKTSGSQGMTSIFLSQPVTHTIRLISFVKALRESSHSNSARLRQSIVSNNGELRESTSTSYRIATGKPSPPHMVCDRSTEPPFRHRSIGTI